MRFSTLASIALLLSAPLAPSADWPQWMGPNRDNVWNETGILTRFPPGGPTILWKSPVAGGYAGPAVASGKVIVTDFVAQTDVKVDNFQRATYPGTERVLCLEEATGKLLWKHEYPVTYTMSYPAGPRCTPLLHAGKVYTLGAEGDLLCLDAAKGSVQWSRNLPKDYGAKTPLWGYAAHPLIDGQKLITLAGGDGSHVVALDKDTGKEIWRSRTSKEQGYAPPLIIEAGGARQLILIHPTALESIDPESGNPYWSLPYEATNGSIIMTPVKAGNLLYAAGYSNKNILVELATERPGAKLLWQDQAKTAICPVNVQPILDGTTLFGFDQNGVLYGVELLSGKRIWESTLPLKSERPVATGTAFLVRNADRYWMFNELGELIITRLSTAGYEEIDRAKVLEPTNVAFGRPVVWCPPAWANRKVFVRNDKECIAVQLASP